jgi:2'-5' RNA ligase
MLLKTYTYSLAFRPEKATIEEVKVFKRILRNLLGVHYSSKNSEAHISLLAYQTSETQHELLLIHLKKIIAQLTPFQIQYDGLGTFKSTIYIRLKDESAERLKNYVKRIKIQLGKRGRSLKNKSNTPHVTIGRELSEEQLITAAWHLSGATLPDDNCDCFVIRRFNEEKGQYDVIAIVPLQGLPNKEGNQLTLF